MQIKVNSPFALLRRRGTATVICAQPSYARFSHVQMKTYVFVFACFSRSQISTCAFCSCAMRLMSQIEDRPLCDGLGVAMEL
jgi:hypothetical protein